MTKEEVRKTVQKELFVLQDLKYRDFHAKLIPSVDKEKVIGIRTPALRAYAKKFGKKEEAKQFLEILPHQYYEENNLQYIDNWATCDLLAVKTVKNHLDLYISEVYRWMESDQPYTIRFGVNMLMKYYLGDNFKIEYPEKVAAIRSEEYYVNMVRAWYFATALAKQYEQILPFLEERRMDLWTHNKTIQKAIESYRITSEQKEYLRTLKIKREERTVLLR